jgi:spermidine synthase
VAVIWQKEFDGKLHEVRSVGGTRRLYTDGVFHSQFNLNHPVTGSIWDLMLLPAFFRPQGSIQRILVLGVGGGAVLRQLNYFLRPNTIVGVEINPHHLHVAERYFEVKGKPYELNEANAIEWLLYYQGEPFDLIIEDLYGEEYGQPARAIAPDANWFNLLSRHLVDDGVLVMNFLDHDELKQSAWFHDRAITERLPYAFRLTTTLYENSVAAFMQQPSSSATLRRNLMKVPELDPRRKASRLRYAIRQLKQPAT